MLLDVSPSAYRLSASFLQEEQEMTRKSPEEKRLRLQGLTVFPKGTTRWEKNAYHFRVALVPIKGDFLANELGWLLC